MRPTECKRAPSTFSTWGMLSKDITKVSRLPVWNPARRADSSGISHRVNVSKVGVLRQWFCTAFIRQNSPVLVSTNSQDPVVAISRLASSTPISSLCFLLTTLPLVPPTWRINSRARILTQGSPVSTTTVKGSGASTLPSGWDQKFLMKEARAWTDVSLPHCW